MDVHTTRLLVNLKYFFDKFMIVAVEYIV